MDHGAFDGLVVQAIDEAAVTIGEERPPSPTRTLAALQCLAQRVEKYSRDYTLLNLCTIEDIAAKYGVSPSGVRRMAVDRHERFGAGMKVGGIWLFTAEEVEMFRPHYKSINSLGVEMSGSSSLTRLLPRCPAGD